MSATYARTGSGTQTTTLTKVNYVTRKVQADFLAILETYGYFSEDYAQKIIHDIRIMLDEEIIDQVKFVWTRSGSNYVLEELAYRVTIGGGLADDRSGGIRYNSLLAAANFNVRVVYTSRWSTLRSTERVSIQSRFQLSWSPGGQLDYLGGSWAPDRTYSKDGYGLMRSRFVR